MDPKNTETVVNADFMEEPQAISGNALAVLNRSEVDVQIATAHRYPRSVNTALSQAETMATLDVATAASCYYMLPRKNSDGQTTWIEGPSIRLAEIFMSAWGHMRCASRIIAEEKDWIVAQGVAHDLQTNVATSMEVRRRISGKRGRYSPDMIAVTAAAAGAIALRNAILKVIPKCYVEQVKAKCKRVAAGDSKTLEQRRVDMVKYCFSTLGLKEDRVLFAIDRKSIVDVTLEDMANLHGMITAIREGTAQIDDVFPDPNAQPSTPPEGTGNGATSATKTSRLAETIANKGTQKAVVGTKPEPTASAAPATETPAVSDPPFDTVPPEPAAPAASQPVQQATQERTAKSRPAVPDTLVDYAQWHALMTEVALAIDLLPAKFDRAIKVVMATNGIDREKPDLAKLREILDAAVNDRFNWDLGSIRRTQRR